VGVCSSGSSGISADITRSRPSRSVPSANKPRGLLAARKLRTTRRENRWADKSYKKRALGNVYKTSPTGGSSHAKGIVLEKVGVEAKQPNSAIRKCVRVQLIKNGKKVTAFVPNDGCLNFLDENDEVLISGFGRRGKGASSSLPSCFSHDLSVLAPLDQRADPTLPLPLQPREIFLVSASRSSRSRVSVSSPSGRRRRRSPAVKQGQLSSFPAIPMAFLCCLARGRDGRLRHRLGGRLWAATAEERGSQPWAPLLSPWLLTALAYPTMNRSGPSSRFTDDPRRSAPHHRLAETTVTRSELR
jgi:small subunit ribosomal protein S23e